MNAHPPPDGDDIDRLLARQYRDTSPDFEARWTELKRELRQAPDRAATPRFGWRTAALAGLAAFAALAVVVFRPVPDAPAPSPLNPSPEMAQVIAMNEVLAQALPLLDHENRLALLHLAVPTRATPEPP